MLLPTFVQDVPNLSFLDPKGKGRCSTCVATVPYVQCGSRKKLTVFVQTMTCSHVFWQQLREYSRAWNKFEYYNLFARLLSSDKNGPGGCLGHIEVGSPFPVWDLPLCQPMEWDQDFCPFRSGNLRDKYQISPSSRAPPLVLEGWPIVRGFASWSDSQKTHRSLVRWLQDQWNVRLVVVGKKI